MIEAFQKIRIKLVNDFYIQSSMASLGYMVLLSILLFIPLIDYTDAQFENYRLILLATIGLNIIKLLFSSSKLYHIENVSDQHLKIHLALVVINCIFLTAFFSFSLLYVPHFQNEFWFIFFVINVINTASAFSVVISPVTVFSFMSILGIIPPLILTFEHYVKFKSIDQNTLWMMLFSAIYLFFLILRARAHQKMMLKLYRYEEEIASQTAISTEAMKLAAIGEMAGGIAHEINNPLAILYLQAKKINDNSNLTDDSQKRFHKIFESIKRIEKVLHGLKTYSQSNRADRSSYSKINIEEALEVAKSLTKSKTDLRKINLEYSFKHNGASIFASKSEMSQVLLHLINNAIEAVENVPSPTISIETYSENGFLFLSIADNGNGIQKEIVDKLFIPFFTTKNPREHHGIGLSTSYAIIDAHQGEIRYEPELKKGKTCFLIKLPLFSE